MLATSGGPLRTAWTRGARALARSAGIVASRGERDPAIYTRGGLARGDFVPGLSDVDVIVVVAGDTGDPSAAANRVRERWAKHVVRVRALGEVFGEPRILEERELSAVVDQSTHTYGLAGVTEGRAAFGDTGPGRDSLRMLERPGLEGVADWVRLAGPERRPGRQPADGLIAAWLELAFYWRHALAAAADPSRPRAGLLCVKLIAEPVRVLLALQGLDVNGPRNEVLRRGLAAMPEEEAVLRRALEAERSLRRRRPAPFAECFESLVRLSDRVARIVDERAFAAGGTSVRLIGAPDGARLPLCDWRAIVEPSLGPETMTLDRSPVSASAVGAASRAQRGAHYAVLRSAAMLVLPTATRERATLRAVACRATDPVSHALLAREESALFAPCEGWSAADVARRAVAEHAAAITGRQASMDDLLAAARAALLHHSIRAGAPALPLTEAATLGELRAHASTELIDEVLGTLPTPSGGAVAELTTIVGRLLGTGSRPRP